MQQAIVGFHQDDQGDWVAELACGHNQHVRHNPPWTSRPWVITPGGRRSVLGQVLNCLKCERGEPRDWPAATGGR
jgi:hypothetical protein